MSDIKYVVIDDGGMAGETIIIFPAFKQHLDFLKMGKVVSGGFVGQCDTTQSKFYTHGESISLKLKSRPEDQVLLDMMLRDRWA